MKSFMRGIVDHKGLLSILAVLVVAIIGLTAGIIINLNNQNIAVDPTEEGDRQLSFLQTYDDVQAEAEKLLLDRPDDIKSIKKLYSDAISQLSRTKDQSFIGRYIIAEATTLEAAGHKQAALDSLLENDITDLELTELEVSEYYRYIIALANELGENSIAELYLNKHRAEIQEVML